jgi:glycosyltransferase involved in cell wall biosynthesis
MNRQRLRQEVTARLSGIACRVEEPQPLRTRPRVTVIVLCYNYGRFLEAAVRSALIQTGVRIQVIVVNDASTDGSLSVARRLAEGDRRIEIIDLLHNLGPVGAFNRALEAVQGDYLVRLDADDMLTPGALERAVALLEVHPNVGFVYARPLVFRGEQQPCPRLGTTSWTVWRGADWLELRCRVGFNCVASPEVVMRASLQRQLGGQSEALPHTHDMEMWLRAAAVSDVGRVNDADAAWVRIHPDSRMRTVFADPLQDLRERAAAFAVLLANDAMPIEGRDELRRLARRRLAEQATDRARRAYDRRRADREPVHDYLHTALELDPSVQSTALWRSLRRRRSAGRWSPWMLMFLGRAVIRRGQETAYHQYGRWSGL